MHRIVKQYFSVLKVTFKAIPLWSTYTIFNSILGEICNIIGSISIVAIVLKSINNKSSFAEVVIPVLLIEAVIILGGFCTSLYYAKVDPIARQLLSKNITSKMIDEIMSTDLKNLDNPQYLNDYSFALDQIEQRLMGSVNTLSNLLSNIIGIAITLYIIKYINYGLAVVAAIAVAASLIVNLALNKTKFIFNNEIVMDNRKKDYVNRVFYMKKYSLELRLLPIAPLLTNLYNNSVKNIIRSSKKYGYKIGILSFIGSFITEVFVFWGTMLILILKIYNKDSNIDPTSLVPVTLAVYALSSYLIGLVGVISSLKENELYTKSILKFLNKEEKALDKGILVFKNEYESIQFKNVFFKYFGNDTNSLNNINIEFRKGKKVALVGKNGSGKTTLIKLLLGLYDNFEGYIELNGNPILDYNRKNYYSLFSVVLQDFQHYATSLENNIAMGIVKSEAQKERICRALEKVNLFEKEEDIRNMMERQLTSEFAKDGLNFSKGEYQKLAISRVFAVDSPIVVLDEPTSSLDPISEFELFNKVMEECSDKTVIIISHRLTATKNADIIYMLDNGNIIERGTHYGLMEKNGEYAHMYSMQAEKYLTSEEIYNEED